MQENNIEKEIRYDEIREMEEHAKKYNEVYDKKEFLKNVSAYEQKIILLNSKKPYEVLNYLDELDLKNTRQILSELSYEEIKDILDLFTTEDKKEFYKNFSDLSLVNQFIVQDKSSSEYIKDLSFDRKVELIDSSNKETVMASAKIYETMPEEERSIVSESISTANSVSVLNEATQYVENNEANNSVEKSNISEEKNDKIEESSEKKSVEEEIKEEIKEEIVEEAKEKLLVEEKVEEKIESEQVEATAEIGVTSIVKEDKNLNEIVREEENLENPEQTNKKTALEEFEAVKEKTEQAEIEIIKQNLNVENKEQEVTKESVSDIPVDLPQELEELSQEKVKTL